ncbi:NAD-dependent epimerase/dehydratase family protein [Jongsikchunia kroppenstedtii]|uniref:NAD-dependent epimerase/dehydratase family protein n=1 Tax=Jongsikchunia kroppenstedtii TaxID=1121721 RepID=UPI0003AAE259|nr:NAD(P)-dependent oxidoreductase [Jongsikchunia kroppenstedtii]
MRVFVAGGTGVVGRRLVSQLVARNHQVIATTTSGNKLEFLGALGAETVVMDGLDPDAVRDAVVAAMPDVIVSEMTALAPEHAGRLNPLRPGRFFETTNRLRSEGTDNLVAAARAAGGAHLIAQSAALFNATPVGGLVKTEDDPLEVPGADAIYHLERAVRGAGGGVVRYGSLYGVGANDDQIDLLHKRMFPLIGRGRGHVSLVHADDAATATVLAVELRAEGVFNIVDDEPAPVADWLPYLAECTGAKPPRTVPTWLARPLAGEMMVTMMTSGSGFSNEKAKRELGWTLKYPSWRQGFREFAEHATPEAAHEQGR